MKYLKLTAAAAAAALIAACGGGGDGGGADGGGTAGGGSLVSVAASSATGLWNGTTSTGREVSALVFPDGTLWAAYASNTDLGVVQGSVNGAARDYNFISGTGRDVTVSTTAQAKQSINGSISAGGQTVTFTGTYDADFERTPSLAEAAGTYTGAGPSAGTTLTLATNGNVTGSQGTCSFSGTATPRTDGNAFNVSITFGGGSCQLGTTTLTGIAYYDASEKALLSVVLNAGRTAGAVFTGTKP